MVLAFAFFFIYLNILFSRTKERRVLSTSVIFFLMGFVMAISHLSNMAYLIILVGLMLGVSLFNHSMVRTATVQCVAVLAGVVLGTLYMTKKMAKAMTDIMHFILDVKVLAFVFVVIMVAVVWFLWSQSGRTTRSISHWTKRWPLAVIIVLVGIYLLDLALVLMFHRSNNRTGTLVDPFKFMAEFGIFPVLCILGLYLIAREGWGRTFEDHTQGPLLGYGRFMLLFLLASICLGSVLFGVAAYFLTSSYPPFSEADRWFVLLNIPLIIFTMVGLVGAFRHGTGNMTRNALRVLASVVMVLGIVFSVIANQHSIDYNRYQTGDTEAASLYMVVTGPDDGTNLMLTHEGIWVPVLLDIDSIAESNAFRTNKEVQEERIPLTNGTLFLAKRVIGEMPFVGGEYQKLYFFNETGKDPSKKNYFHHKVFENGDVRIIISL
jgi:hypothetical protein